MTCRHARETWRQFVLGGGLLLLLLLWGTSRTGLQTGDVYLVGLILLGMISAVIEWSRRAGSSCSVIMNRFGLTFDHPKLPARLIPWSAVGSARYQWLRTRLRIRSRQGPVGLARPAAWLGRP